MAEGDSGEEPSPEHFDGADSTRTKNGMHPHREYDNVALEALEALERGQARVGAASGEDGHVATETSAGWRRAKEGDEKPQRARLAQEPNGGEMEERGPPRTVARA